MTYVCHLRKGLIPSHCLKIDKIPTVPQWEKKHWTQCYNIVKNHDSTYNAKVDKTVNNIITTIMIKDH